MKKVIIILSMFCVSLSGDFVQRWIIPDGKNSYGRVLIGEINYNGLIDIVVRRNQPIKVMFYELNISNQWQLQDSIVDDGDHLLWAMGDFDLDGFSDIVFQKTFGIPNVGIAVYESPDSFTYPVQEVWRDTVGFALVQPISVHDVDKDSFPEIFKLGWRKEDSIIMYYPFGIYECIGNNQYDTIFMGEGLGSLSSTVAFGDFDGDNNNEFLVGNIDGEYQIWECIGNNSYQLLEQQQLPTGNIKDCFSVTDADGDGKLEFVVKGFWVYGTIDAFIFEATGDNTYEIIKTFNFPGGDYYGGYSEAGDVDGDSIPEIVLEARQNVFIIKAAGDDSFYVWDTLPGNSGGSSIAIYDIDGNGLKEIVISGNDETRIYEYELGIEEEAGFGIPTSGFGLQVYPNPIHKKCTIKYVLPQHSNVNVSLFDVAGRLIKKIVNEKQIGGVYYKTFDMTDLPQGIYFFRLETRDYKETRKAILLK